MKNAKKFWKQCGKPCSLKVFIRNQINQYCFGCIPSFVYDSKKLMKILGIK